MAIIMHDLAGADPALRFSPYCWRTRMALAHKGLAVETIPWRFTEKAALAFSVNRHGIVSTARPLCARAILVRQQYGLNRSAGSVPARSCIMIAMQPLPLLPES